MEQINKVDFHITKLESMKSYPKEIFYKGDISLLDKPKISIVGTRRPSSYTKNTITQISSKLSRAGNVIVSGAAMGVDAVAHRAAGVENTIAVLPNGFYYKYPAVNKKLISDIQKNGLCLSQFEYKFKASPWSFVLRNELVVALGDVLIVGEADLDSGSIRSVEFALKMQKDIYVLPHRLGESEGTNKLVQDGLAKTINNIDEFVSLFGTLKEDNCKDELLEFCKHSNKTYEEVLSKYADKLFEYELMGKLYVKDGLVLLK